MALSSSDVCGELCNKLMAAGYALDDKGDLEEVIEALNDVELVRQTLTSVETDRQDFVDGAIHELMGTLVGYELPWDMEWLGEVRDTIQEVVVKHLDMSEMEFYP